MPGRTTPRLTRSLAAALIAAAALILAANAGPARAATIEGPNPVTAQQENA